MLLATACSAGTTPPGSSHGAGVTPASTASRAVIAISPGPGATGVDTTGALSVTAGKGRLTSVAVTAADGTPVSGTVGSDGSRWTPSGVLRIDTRYQVTATAVDSTGRTTTQRSTFTTLVPTRTNIGHFNITPNATYGVGMEVSLRFDQPVTDQAAVKKAVTVTASPGVDVEGHWFGQSRLDFRPQDYWAPGTVVTLHLDLSGVQTSPGVYGKQYKDVSFTVGRSQVSIADDATKTVKVYRNGQLVRTIPASLGAPGRTTYNGKMVIIERDPTENMNSQTVGFGSAYDIPDVPHAQRLTTSGTFIHGNYWSPASAFGQQDTSHGCIGLQDVQGAGDPSTPAAWFYDNSIIGDVVQVVNSPDKTVQPDNGLNGWNMPWTTWITT